MRIDQNGDLHGQISVSKTTGKLKSVAMLYFYVSSDAWVVEQRWLKTGFNLLLETTTPKPFLLPLPNADGSSFSEQEPSYAEACITSRVLLSEAKRINVSGPSASSSGPADNQMSYSIEAGNLLDPGVQKFWTEHSDRCTLPTWSKNLGVIKEDRDRLGRWKPSESDEYVRSSRDIVLKTQKLVADSIKKDFDVDVVGESSTFDVLSVWLKDNGVSEELSQLQIRRLSLSSGGEAVSAEVVQDFPSDIEEEPLEQVGNGQLVVSLERGRNPQTLHCVGRCWRVPGLHYKSYMFIDKEEATNPDPRYMVPFDRICKDCYPSGVVMGSETVADGSSSSSDSE